MVSVLALVCRWRGAEEADAKGRSTRGWRVVDTIYASPRQLPEQWADKVGRDRFGDFMEVLRVLSAEE